MASRQLAREQWKNYFDLISKQNKSAVVNVEVIGIEIGDQTEIKWQPLKGLSHDPKRNSFCVYTEQINHQISHPKDIFVEEKDGFPETIEIIDEDNNKQILKLKNALIS